MSIVDHHKWAVKTHTTQGSGWRTLPQPAITKSHLVMITKLTMIIPSTFLLKGKKKLHNARFEPRCWLSFKKEYKKNIKNVVPAPDPLSPMKYGSIQAKPKLHTSHAQNSKQQHTVSLTLYCITIRVGIAQQGFKYSWFHPIVVVLISIENVVFLQHTLVSADVGSAMSPLVSSMPTIAGYAKVMEKLLYRKALEL